ncbi:hypothetical protein Tco_0109732 [Tanacetum coccineum]
MGRPIGVSGGGGESGGVVAEKCSVSQMRAELAEGVCRWGVGSGGVVRVGTRSRGFTGEAAASGRGGRGGVVPFRGYCEVRWGGRGGCYDVQECILAPLSLPLFDSRGGGREKRGPERVSITRSMVGANMTVFQTHRRSDGRLCVRILSASFLLVLPNPVCAVSWGTSRTGTQLRTGMGCEGEEVAGEGAAGELRPGVGACRADWWLYSGVLGLPSWQFTQWVRDTSGSRRSGQYECGEVPYLVALVALLSTRAIVLKMALGSLRLRSRQIVFFSQSPRFASELRGPGRLRARWGERIAVLSFEIQRLTFHEVSVETRACIFADVRSCILVATVGFHLHWSGTGVGRAGGRELGISRGTSLDGGGFGWGRGISGGVWGSPSTCSGMVLEKLGAMREVRHCICVARGGVVCAASLERGVGDLGRGSGAVLEAGVGGAPRELRGSDVRGEGGAWVYGRIASARCVWHYSRRADVLCGSEAGVAGWGHGERQQVLYLVSPAAELAWDRTEDHPRTDSEARSVECGREGGGECGGGGVGVEGSRGVGVGIMRCRDMGEMVVWLGSGLRGLYVAGIRLSCSVFEAARDAGHWGGDEWCMLVKVRGSFFKPGTSGGADKGGSTVAGTIDESSAAGGWEGQVTVAGMQENTLCCSRNCSARAGSARRGKRHDDILDGLYSGQVFRPVNGDRYRGSGIQFVHPG